MKTITITGFTVSGSDVTITGTWADQTFTTPARQVTIPLAPSVNPGWARNYQMNDTALFIKRVGANSIALLLEGLGHFAAPKLEPTLSWPPRITTQPSNATVAAGSNTSFAVVADATDELSPSYQWARSTDGGSTWTNITGGTTPNDGCTYSNYTTATLGITGADPGQNGYAYKCTVTNGSGSTDTNTVGLTVTAAAAAISVQPSNQSCVHASTAATFSVTASGAGLAYQWQVSLDGVTGWTNLVNSSLGNPGPYTNVTTANMTVTPDTTAQNGYYYRVVITNLGGVVNSTAAQLTVT